jgi:hypothetical protein
MVAMLATNEYPKVCMKNIQTHKLPATQDLRRLSSRDRGFESQPDVTKPIGDLVVSR